MGANCEPNSFASYNTTEAKAAREALIRELEQVALFETEVKEKNHHIRKLQYEATISNNHPAKALQFPKKAKPEDNNSDKQIITIYSLYFPALDCSDPKKFEILNFTVQLRKWTDKRQEIAGRACRGASNTSSSLHLSLAPFQRTPSALTLDSDGAGGGWERGESLVELWAGFLRQEAEGGAVESALSSRSTSFFYTEGDQGRDWEAGEYCRRARYAFAVLTRSYLHLS